MIRLPSSRPKVEGARLGVAQLFMGLLTPHDAGRLIGGTKPHNPRTTDHESGVIGQGAGLWLLTNQLYTTPQRTSIPCAAHIFRMGVEQ